MNNRKNSSSQPFRNYPSKKDHIPLGIINPSHIQKNTNIKSQQPQLPLQVHSKPFNMKNRTHYQNELQNKDSIPLRLREPRVYVQNIVKRYQKKELILPSKKGGSNQYQLTVSFYRKIGQSLPQKTKKCLSNIIKQFNNQKRYSKPLQHKIFFTKDQFIEFIIQNFKKFNHQEAQIFWNLGYNQLRFKDRISMEAFVFNFYKFYLQTQNFNNMFSETALRQRLIDLRVSLIDWANNQIIFKYNMRNIREKSKAIQKYLKISHNQDAFCDFQMVIQQCQQSHIKLKFLSEFLFNLSDNKNFTQQKVKNSLHQKIEDKLKKIQISRQVIKSFFQTNDYTQSEYFPITDILQFCKVDIKNEQTITYIISWIQCLFNYLYYNKLEDKQLGLVLNLQTKRLQCANILNINAKIIKQYDRFLEKQCNAFVQISKQFLFAVDDGLKKMPELQGHKKVILQCNFMSEIALRFIRFVDLGCFCKILQIVEACQNQTNIQQLILILSHTYKEQQIKRTMKNLFSLTFNNQTNQLIEEAQKESSQSQENKIQASLKKYNKIKQQALLLKLKQETNSANNNDCQPQQIKVTSPKSINSRQNLENIIIEDKKVDKQLLNGSSFCPHYYKYNLELSRQTNQTISAVQSLQSRLFQLLQFDQ